MTSKAFRTAISVVSPSHLPAMRRLAGDRVSPGAAQPDAAGISSSLAGGFLTGDGLASGSGPAWPHWLARALVGGSCQPFLFWLHEGVSEAPAAAGCAVIARRGALVMRQGRFSLIHEVRP